MNFTESTETDVTTDGAPVDHVTDKPLLSPEHVLIGADVMTVVCVLVNVLLLMTVFSSRRLRRGATAGLVVTLTVANILTVVCNKIILELMWLYEMEPVADLLCKTGTFIDASLSTTSTFILVAVAYDQYVAVCRPLSLQKRSGTPLIQGIIRAALCALVATLVALPQTIINRMVDDVANGNSSDAIDTNETTTASSLDYDYVTLNNDSAVHTVVLARYCEPDPPPWLEWYGKAQAAVSFVLCYIIPMTIIFVLYGITAVTLINSGTLDRRRSQDKQRKDREHAAKSLIGLAFINLLVMLPMNVLMLIFDYKLVENEYLQELAFVALYTYVITCMINAIMVYVLSQKHRAQLIKIVTCALCRQRGRPHQTIDRTNSSQLTLQSRFRMERLRSSSKSTGADESDSHSTSNITTSSKY